jgi:hypothetical protein
MSQIAGDIANFRQTNELKNLIRQQGGVVNNQPHLSGFKGADIVVGQVLDPAAEKLYQVTNSNMVLLQVLAGDTLEPIPNYKFFAMTTDNSVLATGTKVIVLLTEQYPPMVVKTIGGSSSETVFMELHSHQGFYDGGYLNHLGGGL